MDLNSIAQRIARTRSDEEGVVRESFKDFRGRWENHDAFLRFEEAPRSGREEWIPATLNRDSTFGDIWGVWSFYLKYPWPENKASLTKMPSAYIFTLRGSPKFWDTGNYSEHDYEKDIEKLTKTYGDKVNNFQNNHNRRKKSYEEEGLVLEDPGPQDLSPADRLYHVISHIEGNTRSTNFILRKIGYEVVIDSGAVVTEGVYSPSVAAAILNPSVINIKDSFSLKKTDRK